MLKALAQYSGPQPTGASATAYGRLLRAEAFALDPQVRNLHLAGGGARGRGLFAVRWGPSVLHRFLARAARLPRPGTRVLVTLRIDRDGLGETWHRTFAGTPVPATYQFDRDGDLRESVGRLRFRYRLRAEAGGLVFDQREVALRCFGRAVRIPPRIAPVSWARAVGGPEDGCVDVHVILRFPAAGTVLEYTGRLWQEASS
jgi:hypothetical protein